MCPTLAKRLPYCDHVVALDKSGRILEQGTFEKLNSAGGYVSAFDLPLPDWSFTPEKHDYEAPPKYSERQVIKVVTEEDVQAEANRRTGDVAIYRYYIGSVGWIPTLVFVISIVIFIFGISFPSEYYAALFSDSFANHTVAAIWVKMWAEFNEDHPNKRLGFYLGIYAMLGGLALFFLVVSCWCVFVLPRLKGLQH